MTASAVTPLLSNHQAPLRQQKGYSIIELSIALAIISIILVTALAGVQRVLRSNNVNNDLRGLNLTAANLATMYSTQANTDGLTMATRGLLHVLTHSHRYVIPVQANRYNGVSRLAKN